MVGRINAVLPVREADGSAPAADQIVVEQLARLLTQDTKVASWLVSRAIEERSPRRAAAALDRRLELARAVMDACDRLGLSTRSRASLGVDLVRGMSAAEAWQHKIDEMAAEGGGDAGEVVDGVVGHGSSRRPPSSTTPWATASGTVPRHFAVRCSRSASARALLPELVSGSASRPDSPPPSMPAANGACPSRH